MKQSTILLETRDREEDRSVSPKRQQNRDPEITGTISIASSVAAESNIPPCVKQMNKSVKFVEDGVIFTEHLQDYLEENNDYVVVGVIGAQATGKSSILNLLAHKNITEQLKQTLFTNTETESESGSFENIKLLTDNFSKVKVDEKHRLDVSDESKGDEFDESRAKGESKQYNTKAKGEETKTKREESKTQGEETCNLMFDIQNSYTAQGHLNATTGIDLFITQNRVIFLDCQPFLSASVLDDLINMDDNHKRSTVISDCQPVENSGEIQSLQLTAFLMSVCHIIILVQDWFVDSNVIRFIQTAEMLKPTMNTPEDEYVDYFPHLILLHNKGGMEDFSPKMFNTMQKFYRLAFKKTKMHLESGMGLGTGRIMPYLCPENCGEPINLFVLPEYSEENGEIFFLVLFLCFFLL